MSEELSRGQREMFREAVRRLARDVKKREREGVKVPMIVDGLPAIGVRQESIMNKVLIAGEELRIWLESGWSWRGAGEETEVALSVSEEFKGELKKEYWRAYDGWLWPIMWCPPWLMPLASIPIFVFWPLWWPIYWLGKRFLR